VRVGVRCGACGVRRAGAACACGVRVRCAGGCACGCACAACMCGGRVVRRVNYSRLWPWCAGYRRGLAATAEAWRTQLWRLAVLLLRGGDGRDWGRDAVSSPRALREPNCPARAGLLRRDPNCHTVSRSTARARPARAELLPRAESHDGSAEYAAMWMLRPEILRGGRSYGGLRCCYCVAAMGVIGAGTLFRRRELCASRIALREPDCCAAIRVTGPQVRSGHSKYLRRPF
jgi:hypothetical protein